MVSRKMILNSGLVILFALWILLPLSESSAQSARTLDISNPLLQDKILSGGFITPKAIPALGEIVGSGDAEDNLGEGDLIYVKLDPSTPAKPGDQFYIARFGRKVAHPITGEDLGRVVRFAGIVVILDGTGRVVPARIKRSFFQARYGDLIVPAAVTPPPSLSLRLTKQVTGTIVDSPEGEENLTQQEVVYVDRGLRDGLIMGDLFTLYQTPYYTKEAKDNGVKLPLMRVGEGVLVLVNENTSTMLITKSSQSIYVGDMIVSGR